MVPHIHLLAEFCSFVVKIIWASGQGPDVGMQGIGILRSLLGQCCCDDDGLYHNHGHDDNNNEGSIVAMTSRTSPAMTTMSTMMTTPTITTMPAMQWRCPHQWQALDNNDDSHNTCNKWPCTQQRGPLPWWQACDSNNEKKWNIHNNQWWWHQWQAVAGAYIL